jgi:hypothetical protein
MAEALELEGYAVARAINGAEALDLVRQQRPRAIVLDLMMAVVDGWRILEHCPGRRAVRGHARAGQLHLSAAAGGSRAHAGQGLHHQTLRPRRAARRGGTPRACGLSTKAQSRPSTRHGAPGSSPRVHQL